MSLKKAVNNILGKTHFENLEKLACEGVLGSTFAVKLQATNFSRREPHRSTFTVKFLHFLE